MLRVCIRFVKGVFRVYEECVQGVSRVCYVLLDPWFRRFAFVLPRGRQYDRELHPCTVARGRQGVGVT